MGPIKPHIGKNVIETLTSGMYEDALIIYREYVQNAADAIDLAVENNFLNSKDDGRIDISIDSNKRIITIEDNGTGIKGKNVLSFLGDVANSQKDVKKQKGFRGIGRLGGLGYCEELVFETSYKGESKKSVISLNATLLKIIIDNKANTDDAATVMGTITSVFKEDENAEKHYFKVTLKSVTNDNLLAPIKVNDYLSMVAPIPFAPGFEFKSKIYKYFRENKFGLDEYDVHLNINDTPLYKPYKSILYEKKRNGDLIEFSEILDVSCFSIENEENELIAIGWFGISNRLNYQIPDVNIEGGVRLRKENIAIGNKLTLSNLFKQFRQNLNYIGEVHAIGHEFKPNARRDYFNDSKTTFLLEMKLSELFVKLGGLIQDSSLLHNRKKSIEKYRTELECYESDIQSGQFTEKEIEQKRENLFQYKRKAIQSSQQLLNLKERSSEDRLLSIVYDKIIGGLKIKIDDREFDLESNIQAYQLTLTKLSTEQRNIVKEIFDIIEENFNLDNAEFLKKKIAEKYK